VEVLREVNTVDPSQETSLFLAMALRADGQRPEAEDILLAVIGDDRAPASARVELARLYLDRGAPELALHHAEAAVHRGEPCYDVLARAYSACGEHEMARVTVEVALASEETPAVVRAICRKLESRWERQEQGP
jgi:Tfp pilus assembly protein PilF